MSPPPQRPRIIGAGLPRTGTSSLTAALEILGFGPVLHGVDDNDRQKYTKLLHARNAHPHASAVELGHLTGVSLSDLMSPYRATLDYPTADLSVELSGLFPKSLVILTVRDSDEAWWRSWAGTWGAYHRDTIKGCLLRILIWPVWEVTDSIRMVAASVAGWQLRHGCQGPAVHARHNAEIIERIPAARLLVFNVKQGWGPLCRFLGMDIPDVPFPRVNDSEEAERSSRILKIQGAVTWAIGLLVVGGGAWTVRHLRRM